jgi:hypothetical protein
MTWTWHKQSASAGGKATVVCSYRDETRSATVSFRITH